MRLSPGMALIATPYGMEYKLFAITAAELAALIAGAGGEDVASKRRLGWRGGGAGAHGEISLFTRLD